jgi:hypothetical protein
MMLYVLVLLAGSPMIGTSIPGYPDRQQCESAGEAWKVEAKKELNPRYYCIPGPSKLQNIR